jgi:hypothetical protein
MFNKIAKFRLPVTPRPMPGAIVPANDNRRGGRSAPRRARAPRLICRWSLPEGASRPVCRWQLERAEEPIPSLPSRSAQGSPIHKTVVRLSRQSKPVKAARDPVETFDARAASVGHGFAIEWGVVCCTHVTRWCDLTSCRPLYFQARTAFNRLYLQMTCNFAADRTVRASISRLGSKRPWMRAQLCSAARACRRIGELES